MSVEELLVELRKLDRADKVRAMRVLVMELAVEEQTLLLPGATYDVWSPYDATAAAEILAGLLDCSMRSEPGGEQG